MFHGPKTFIVPPNSHTVTIPGIFSVAESIEPLQSYLLSTDELASVSILENPFIVQGDSLSKATEWLKLSIQNAYLRIAEVRAHKVAQYSPSQYANTFQLDDSPWGIALTKALETDLPKLIQNPTSHNSSAPEPFIGFIEIIHSRLTQIVFQTAPENIDEHTCIKVRDKLMDQIAPRIVLIGHSMGGLISYKTLLEYQSPICPISMVIGLSSPFGGTEEMPGAVEAPYQYLLKMLPKTVHPHHRSSMKEVSYRLFPGIPQMRKDSQEIQHIQSGSIPYNTTVLSVGTTADTLVRNEDTLFSPNKTGHVHLTVPSVEGPISHFLPQPYQQLVKFLFPLHWTFEHHKSFKGLRYHCGILDHSIQYWGTQGYLNKALFHDPSGIPLLISLLSPEHTEGVRETLLNHLINVNRHKKIGSVDLRNKIHEVAEETLPFHQTSGRLARQLLG